MKNKLFFIFLLALLPRLGFSQISIDSFKVYHQNYFVDSVYVSGTTTGQSLAQVDFYSTNATCGPVYITYTFEGCSATTPAPFDTVVAINRFSALVYQFTVWDTIASCASPAAPITTDTADWSNCMLSLEETSFSFNMNIYPNPAHEIVHLELPAVLQVHSLSIGDMRGRELRQFMPQQRSLDISDLQPGLYFLRVETEKGPLLKRLVIE